jgi:adenine-specific DNA-methyltransferase
MKRISPGDADTESAGIVADSIDALKRLFPEAVVEGKIDFDVLRQLLGEAVDGGDETYGLNWAGKSRARQLALTPSTATLLPCPAESVDWETTGNVMIEGDNLEVLKLLRKSYSGRVKAIFIDPPYNTGRDIIYPNDYSDGIRTYLELTGRGQGNPETNGRFHSNWLSMIYPRLKLAKDLLRPDGVLFCTIDENEAATLAIVLKEIFGEDSHEHATISIVHNPRGQQGTNISYVHETGIIVYPADKKKYLADVLKSEVDSRILRDSGTESDRADARNCFYPFIVHDGKIVDIGDVPSNDFHPAAANVRRGDGSIEIWPMTDAGDEKKWRYARASVPRILDKLEPKMGRANVQIIFHKNSGTMRSVWQNARYDASEYGTKLLDEMMSGAGFTFPKSLWTVYDALKIMTESDPDALVLDFFAGSGTTGHALMELNKDIGGNRKYILVQLPEPLDPGNKHQAGAAALCASLRRPLTLAEITKERLRRAGAAIGKKGPQFKGDTGFRVFKLASSNTEQSMLYQLLLKLGSDLCVPVVERHIAGKTMQVIGGGALLVCLSDGLSKPVVEEVALGIVALRDELSLSADTRIVFKDSGFTDDDARTRMAAILKQNGVGDVESL